MREPHAGRRQDDRRRFDAVIVGGGVAGLSAALWLGRYGRSVAVFDVGQGRNQPAWAVHGYPGLSDPAPQELRRRLEQQARGAGAEARPGEVAELSGEREAFELRTAEGDRVHARRVLLAYGLRDYLPALEGIRDLYGTSVFHCADCDGPAVAGGRIGVLGWDRHGANQALYLRHFSEHVALLANGAAIELDQPARAALRASDIDVDERTVRALVGHGGNLTQIEFDEGEPMRLDALFFHLGSEPRCNLAQQIGCELDDDGYIVADQGQETSVRGVHAAGDITGHPHLAVIAAAEGVRAALAMHRSLLPDSRHV